MKTKDEILSYLKVSRNRFAYMYGVQRIGLFGSVVHGKLQRESDIDVLVEMPHPTFDQYMDLKFELEDTLGMPIDLVLADTVKKKLRPVIEKEVIYA